MPGHQSPKLVPEGLVRPVLDPVRDTGRARQIVQGNVFGFMDDRGTHAVLRVAKIMGHLGLAIDHDLTPASGLERADGSHRAALQMNEAGHFRYFSAQASIFNPIPAWQHNGGNSLLPDLLHIERIVDRPAR